jgi:hypothetical protein
VASTLRVDLNLAGINALMKSGPVAALLAERARAIADAAGPGFEAVTDNTHPWVARAWVQAATPEAARAEATDKVLTSAVGTAR